MVNYKEEQTVANVSVAKSSMLVGAIMGQVKTARCTVLLGSCECALCHTELAFPFDIWPHPAKQIIFGVLGDSLGRKPAFVMTCLLCIMGCLGSACVVDTAEFGVYTQLAAWRFVLGLGVGGEYPLSATITSESSARSSRGRDLALLFSMQGFGRLICNLVLIGAPDF